MKHGPQRKSSSNPATIMKPNLFKLFLPDKPTLIVWVPLLAVAMWYGISQHFEDKGLYAVYATLATLDLSHKTILLVRKWKEWRRQKEREPMLLARQAEFSFGTRTLQCPHR